MRGGGALGGRVDASADFRDFILDFGIGNEPVEWTRLLESDQPISQPGKIYSWDLNDIPSGIVTLRLRMRSIRDTSAVIRLHLNIQVPTPTPTVTVTLTPTPTMTEIPLPTVTLTPVATSMPTITLTPPPVVTDIPVPSATATPSPTNPGSPAN